MQQYFLTHGGPDSAAVTHQTVVAMGQTIRAQATIMSYADCFALSGVVLLGAVVCIALVRGVSAVRRAPSDRRANGHSMAPTCPAPTCGFAPVEGPDPLICSGWDDRLMAGKPCSPACGLPKSCCDEMRHGRSNSPNKWASANPRKRADHDKDTTAPLLPRSSTIA